MKRLLILSGLVLGASVANSQAVTFTSGAAVNTLTSGSVSFATSGSTVGLSGTGVTPYNGNSARSFTINNVATGVNNRFDISVASTIGTNVGGSAGFTQNASVVVSGAGSVTRSTSSSAVQSQSFTDRFIAQTGATFTLTSAVSGTKGNASASGTITGSAAPAATGSITSGSVASAGSPVVDLYSSANHWVFDFPGNPATGTATINLSNTAGTFSRALNGLGLASGHRDNVRLEVTAFLDGIQVGTTQVSTVNTTLAPLAGTGTNNIAFNSIPSLSLGVSDLYNQTRALTVVTKLIGTAYYGNTTSLGDYTIASSTFSGVTLQGVPEPGTIAGLSLGLLAFARRRKSK